MQIIPAVDLLGGVVVHGVAGRRSEYRPLTSLLAADPQPATVARGLIDSLGLREFYVADLDAITGGEPDWASYQRMIQCGASLWIDAGVTDLQRALVLKRFADVHPTVTGIIVGSESLTDSGHLEELVAQIGPQRLIFSLDLAAGKVRTVAPQWVEWRSGSSPGHAEYGALQIATDVIAAGVRRVIVLDVAAVGVGKGCPTLNLCRELRSRHADIELISGGGIRNAADVEQLAAAGCDAALVATALHDGRIDLRNSRTRGSLDTAED